MLPKEIILSYFAKATPKRYNELISAFGTLNSVWENELSELKKSLPWEENLIHEFLLWRDETDEKKIEHELDSNGIHCVTIKDPAYPKILKEIYDPPFCLFVRGTLPTNDTCIGVVGTRKCTTYGKQVTQELTAALANQGITIVSGLALGIDGYAHEATLLTGGKTIAVLGGGIDDGHIAPRPHLHLAKEIINHGGAVISEYPPGFLPTAYSFPRRNRIIAGLSLGTLVTEAPEESGALITAQCSLDTNRDVFAVPQNITSLVSVGTNNLIKQGAKLVSSADDILEALNLQSIGIYDTRKTITPDSTAEATLIPLLSREPVHIDMLMKQAGIDRSVVSSTMTIMEMKGKVRNVGGMMYVLASSKHANI